MLYIGVSILGWPEDDVWRMTPYKLLKLFRAHMDFNPEKFGRRAPEGEVDIDVALEGL